MSSVGAPRHDPVPIGVSAEPPFAKTPDPATLFAARVERLRALAEGHVLAPYLRLFASFALGLLVRELGYRRGAVSPFLVGY
jgi:FdhE protein